MKLVRYGAAGREKPGIIDGEGRIRDLSAVVPDIDGDALSPKSLTKLSKLKLDKLPPVIKLKESGKLEYSKNKSATIELAVTDDHAVKSVSAMARLEGATAWESVPVSDLGSGNFVIQVAPELHKNQPMDLYIVATDYAGHVAQLGTAEKPLKLKKKWSLF